VKLSKFKDPVTGIEYNSILTIVKQITKYRYFILFWKSTDASKTAYIVIRIIVANYGLSQEWITDRDSKFTSNFWKTMFGILEVKSKALTAYYL
jgi:hypothetical protein